MGAPTTQDIVAVLTAAGLSADAVEPVGGPDIGSTTWTFRVGEEWIVQVARYPPVAEALERQAELMPIVRDAVPFAVAVPQRIGEHAGCPVFRYRAVSGRPFSAGDDPGELAWMLRELHAVPTGRVSETVGQSNTLAGWWHAQERFRSAVETALFPHVDTELRMAMAAEFDRFFAEDWQFEPVFVHADLGSAHVLLDGSGALSGVIDFDWAGIGDPVLDFVGLHTDLGQRVLRRVATAYGDGFDQLRLWFYWWLNPNYPLVYAGEWLADTAFQAGVDALRARLAWLERMRGRGSD